MKNLKDESWFGTHKITIKNSQQQEKWFYGIDNINNYFLKAEINGLSIGIYKALNIDWISRSVDSGFDVFSEFRGKGYGHLLLEAGIDFCFEILNANRLSAEVLSNNLASQKCHLKCGFLHEGTKRQSVFKCSNYLDSMIFGILRDSWINSERLKNYNYICNISYKPKNGEM